MARGRSSDSQFVEMLLSFRYLPLWVSPLGAACVFGILYYALPAIVGKNMVAAAFAGIGHALAPYIAILIILAGLYGAVERWWRRRLVGNAVQPDGLSKMSWRDFERMIGQVYRQQGFRVVARGGSQADGGIDLELHGAGQRVLVQ